MKINLAVLFGGNSVEHEVSIISALQAIRSLNKEKYEVIPVYITKESEFFAGDRLLDIKAYTNIPQLLKECRRVTFLNRSGRTLLIDDETKLFGKRTEIPVDIAFPIVHGTNVEDGTLAGFLNQLHLPYVGCDIMSSALCMDKYYSKMILKAAGIPVLDCVQFTAAEQLDTDRLLNETEAHFPYPVIVKPVNLGSSVGITKADDREALAEAIRTAFTYADRLIIEPAVQHLKEINCSVLGDRDEAEASECESPVNSDKILSYEDKYMSGGKSGKTGGGSKGMADLQREIPAKISDELRTAIRETSVRAFKVLGCGGVVRIDYLTDTETGKFWLNEVNTIPGSLSFYLWKPVGTDYPELLDKMIALALKRKRRSDETVFSFDTNLLATFAEGNGAKGAKR
ncbi:MAG: D-alanine--D-alanine ligase [Oscillospiraceae bacterium]|nr:D-alanine--D-alanine ligase [Oscillospiraceae bacterium]